MDEPRVKGAYEKYEVLGEGAFAQVFRAKHIPTGVFVACKAIPKEQISDDGEFALLQREVQMMKMLDHPFISAFFEVFDDHNYFFIATELADRGSLLDHIVRSKGLCESEARRIFCQLGSVIDYMQVEMRMVHRDIKPENILLDRNFNIRLIDFGFSRPYSKDDSLLGTLCGSPAYMAPEVIEGRPYTAAADLWSMGVLLCAMLTASLPFGNGDETSADIFGVILSTEPRIPAHVSPELKNLIQRLLTKDPMARLSIRELRHHAWVAESDHAKYFRSEFRQSNMFRTQTATELDPLVELEMRNCSYDVGGLMSEVKMGFFSDRVAAYKILRRAKMVDEIKVWEASDDGQRPKKGGTAVTPVLRCNSKFDIVIPGSGTRPAVKRPCPAGMVSKGGVYASPSGTRMPLIPFLPGRT
jgi:serine/threonine protein kinase